MNHVARMPRLASMERIRGTATALNSPREMEAGDVMPLYSHDESASKSNVRQTVPLCIDVAPRLSARELMGTVAIVGIDGAAQISAVVIRRRGADVRAYTAAAEAVSRAVRRRVRDAVVPLVRHAGIPGNARP